MGKCGLRMRTEKTIEILIVLSIVGGTLKIYGSFVGGSKSIFVDAMTSIANTLAIILILKFFRVGMEPPDKDHHYGHYRLMLGGSISMLMLYSFVAGIIILDLIVMLGKPYEVGYESPLYATIALIPYGLAIYIAKKSHSVVAGYAGFTSIELIESLISIISSLGGAIVNYVIDFIGAITLTSYLFIELIKSFREVVISISDIAPRDVVENILKIVKDHGVEVDRIRVRRVLENMYHGDIVVRFSPSTPLEEAHRIADNIEKKLKEQGIDITVHLEPSTRVQKHCKNES